MVAVCVGGRGLAIKKLKQLDIFYVEYSAMPEACDCPNAWSVSVVETEPAKMPPRPTTTLTLDLFPIGRGLPLVVNNRIQELIEKRDKTDSGFDLPTPHEVVVPPHTTARVKLGVKATVTHEISFQKPSGEWSGCAPSRKAYWLAPRSSISKTPLILANSMGVIDAGYNGELQAAFHNTSDAPYIIQRLDRLVQIVSGDLSPFYEINLRSAMERPTETARGEGGFGSTGAN